MRSGLSRPQLGIKAACPAFDVVFLDLMMPGMTGMEVLAQIKQSGVSSEVIIITGHSTVESAVEAMKQGAADYVSKPFSPDQLKMVLKKVSERSALVRENLLLRPELELNRGSRGSSASRSMEHVFSLIKQVAPTDGTVLIPGKAAPARNGRRASIA